MSGKGLPCLHVSASASTNPFFRNICATVAALPRNARYACDGSIESPDE